MSKSRSKASRAKKQPPRVPAKSAQTKSVKSEEKSFHWWWVAAPVIAIVLGAIVYVLINGNQGTSTIVSADNSAVAVPIEITVPEAFEKYEAGTFFLDVRQPEEWNEFHAPNSTLIPLGELQGRLSELPKNQEIVVVCRSGNRSQEGRDILLKAGFPQVSSMAGGLNEWKSAGYPTVSGP